MSHIEADIEAERQFTVALPKAELHAHLSGSVDVDCLRKIWMKKQALGRCLDLEDPKLIIHPNGGFHDVLSFFPLFDKYIYTLCDDLETIRYMTMSVLQNFQDDGVVHLELRTTPRENIGSGLTKEAYVAGVLGAIGQFNSVVDNDNVTRRMRSTLILSIDRRMTPEQADSIVDLAIKYKQGKGDKSKAEVQGNSLDHVVAVDLCGNPAKGNVTNFTNAFRKAKANGLGITIHFAEIPLSSGDEELQTILSWKPDRLGHVIHVKPQFKKMIEERRLGLELCLSCNVLAKLTTGGFAMHHFGEWMKSSCPIALSTDDVGVFGSPLSNEYSLAAEHFGLGAKELISLARSAAEAVFSGRERLNAIIDQFDKSLLHVPERNADPEPLIDEKDRV